MNLPVSSKDNFTVQLQGTTWLVDLEEASDGVVGLRAFPEADGAPSEPNIYWDIAARNFEEIPEDLPTKVRTAIYQSMRTGH
ncbi:MAG: hypothetical protein DRI90_06205 [Deltaproteobacteria bacterium]|nr:MAG: hypothetical protein DRI90_06205 [Deltaproteobacteria bacterium]